MKVFFDTSAFIALNVPEDRWHEEALAKQEALLRSRSQAFTSDAVLYETLNWFAVKAGPSAAEAFGRRILASAVLRTLVVGPADVTASLAILVKFRGIGLSFVDASAVHMVRTHGLGRVFSFDRHFEKAGLRML